MTPERIQRLKEVAFRRQAGLTVAAEASEHSTAGLAQAILAKESSLG